MVNTDLCDLNPPTVCVACPQIEAPSQTPLISLAATSRRPVDLTRGIAARPARRIVGRHAADDPDPVCSRVDAGPDGRDRLGGALAVCEGLGRRVLTPPRARQVECHRSPNLPVELQQLIVDFAHEAVTHFGTCSRWPRCRLPPAPRTTRPTSSSRSSTVRVRLLRLRARRHHGAAQ